MQKLVKTECRRNKAEYYENKFNQPQQKKFKKFYQVVGDILGKSKSQMSITTPDAEELNNFFVSVGPKLANVF